MDGDTPTIDMEALRSAATHASALMRMLANPDRLLLLCELATGERNVGELELATGIRQPTLSQQLTVLRSGALVATRREGKNIYYRIASPQAMAVMATLYAQFCGPAAKEGKAPA